MADVVQKRSDLETVTPMMQQYLDIRAQYEGHILMYRLGDFYECFFEDAVVASRELELTLTGRDCGDGKRAAMCGVPFHKADVYIGKLVEKGYKVAICEQTEDPKSAVGLVKRDVIRVVTPGTVTDGSLLAETRNNYLCSLFFGPQKVGMCFADVSTGDVSVTDFSIDDETSIENELTSYLPTEAILNLAEDGCRRTVACLRTACHAMVSAGQRDMFDYARCGAAAKDTFGDKTDVLSTESRLAVGALVLYIKQTQKTDVAFVEDLRVYAEGQYLELDYNTRRNLELTESMRGKDRRGTLLWTLDATRTAMGARLLHSWVLKPLLNPSAILRRQAAVGDLLSDVQKRDTLGEYLSDMLDLERLTAKAVYGTANAKDLRAICQSIAKLPEFLDVIRTYPGAAMKNIAENFDILRDLYELLDAAIVDTPPYTIREGGMIRDGFNEDVDYYRNIKANASDIMHSIEEREREETGIRTLRVDYNKVFGYYIEVTKSLVDQVPNRYIRKQTLTNCERYITQELKDMENTIFTADGKIVEMEYDLFIKLRQAVVDVSERIRKTASAIAEVDVYRSFAEVASKNNYACPDVDISTELTIEDGRHPVVEKFVTDSYFVPNNTKLDTGANRMMIITGPNMAGKSTYMRQVALIVIMAQIGSYVPARQAHVGIVDKVFTRVGASDDLASGQSTFMLEMSEVAAILKNATQRSLIVYDEVGRGTSTYDGMAIARAVVEYTHSKKIGAKTLFATHYHELISMENEWDGVVNYHIAAKKKSDTIVFLRKIVRGGTDDSYGIEVAKLAGVPNEVVKRAKEILADIEQNGHAPVSTVVKEEEPDLLTGLAFSKDTDAADRIRKTDLNTLTPIEAMNFLYELKKLVSDEEN